MKTYTDNRFGYKIDLSNDWVLDNYEPPIIARILFWIFYGGPLKKGMAFARGSNDTLETLNISVEKMSPDVSPELTRRFFMEYAQQSVQSQTLERSSSGEENIPGLLIGVELKPEADGARRFCEALKAKVFLTKRHTIT